MTLRNIEEPKEENTLDTNTIVKMERFLIWMKEIALYVGKDVLTGYYQEHPMNNSHSREINNIDNYDACILQKREKYWPYHDRYLCVTGGKGESDNPYVKLLVENIFPVYPINPEYFQLGTFWKVLYQRKLVLYGEEYVVEGKVQEEISKYELPWRDDLKFSPTQYSQRILSNLINCIRDYDKNRWRQYKGEWKHYIIFWNLFLAAMDDDIYNEQLATVAELAACFGFDEPMMRDWCRAVEYVFAGNKLSEDCDLECETVEGARFFLHKEE